jgi:hypothetical protein
MDELAASSRRQGMGFKYEVGVWDVGKEPVEDVVDELARKVVMQKSMAEER